MYGAFNAGENAQYQSGSIKYYSPTELSRICRQNAESVSLRDSENYMKRMKHAENFEQDRHHRKHNLEKQEETEERGRRKDKKEKRKHKKEYFDEMPTYEQYYMMTQQQQQKDDKKDKKHKKRKNKEFSELNYQDLQCLINDYNRDMNAQPNYVPDSRKYQRSRSIDQIPTRDITSDQKVKKSDRPKSVDRREDHHPKKPKDMHVKGFPPMPPEAMYQVNDERHQSKKHKGKSKKKKQNMADALDFVSIDQLNEQTMHIQEERFKHHKHGGKWYDDKNSPHGQQREIYGDYNHGKPENFKTIQSFHQSMDDKIESSKNRKKERRKDKMKEERRGESEKDYNTLKKYMKKMGKDPEKEGFYFNSKDDVDMIKMNQEDRRGRKDKKHYKEAYHQYFEMEPKPENDYAAENKKKQKNRRKNFVPVDLGFEEQEIPPKHRKKHEQKGGHRPKTETKKRDSAERMRSMSLSAKDKRDHFEEYMQKRHVPIEDNEIGLKAKYRSESSLDSVSRRNKDLVYLYQNKDPPEQSEKCDAVKPSRKGESEKGRRPRLKEAGTIPDKMNVDQSPYDRNQMVLPTEPKRDITDILNMQRKAEAFEKPTRRDAETQPASRLSRSRQRSSKILRDEYKNDEEPTKEVHCFDVGVGTSTVNNIQFGDTIDVVKTQPQNKSTSSDKKQTEPHVKKRSSKNESLDISKKDYNPSENTLGIVVKGVEPTKKVTECQYTSGFKFPSETPVVNRLECKVLSVVAITPGKCEEEEAELAKTPKKTKSTPQLQHKEVVEAATSPQDRKTERLMKYYNVDSQNQSQVKQATKKESPRQPAEEKQVKNSEMSFKDLITSKLTDYLKKLQEDSNETLEFQTDDPGVVKLVLPFDCVTAQSTEVTPTTVKENPQVKPLKESFSDLCINYSDTNDMQEDNLDYSVNIETELVSQDREIEYVDQGNTANITDSRNIYSSNVNYKEYPIQLEADSLISAHRDNINSCPPSSRVVPGTERNIVPERIAHNEWNIPCERNIQNDRKIPPERKEVTSPHFEKTEGYLTHLPTNLTGMGQPPQHSMVNPYQANAYDGSVPQRSTFMENVPMHPMMNTYQNSNYENAANLRLPHMDATTQNMMNAYPSNTSNNRQPHMDNVGSQNMMNPYSTSSNIRSPHMDNVANQDIMNAYPTNTYENQHSFRPAHVENTPNNIMNQYQSSSFESYDTPSGMRPPPHMENPSYNMMNAYQSNSYEPSGQMRPSHIDEMNYRNPYTDNFQTSPRAPPGGLQSPQPRNTYRQYPEVPYPESPTHMRQGGMKMSTNADTLDSPRMQDVGNWNNAPENNYTPEYRNFENKPVEAVVPFEDTPRNICQRSSKPESPIEEDILPSRRQIDTPIESKYAKAQSKAIYQEESRNNIPATRQVQEDNDVSSRPTSPETKKTMTPAKGNVTDRSLTQKHSGRKKPTPENIDKIPQILEKQLVDSAAKTTNKNSSIPKRVGRTPRQGAPEHPEEILPRTDYEKNNEPLDRKRDYEDRNLGAPLDAWDGQDQDVCNLGDADLHQVAPPIDKQEYSSSLEKCLHWNIRNSATVVMSELTDPAANKTPETEKSTEKSTVIPKKSHIPVAAKKERPSSSGKDRAGSAGGEIPCHMFLTKTFKCPPGQSAYEKRKQYDTRIRKNVKKRSLSESSGPTKNLIYEVRYFNVINNCVLPISDLTIPASMKKNLNLACYRRDYRRNDSESRSVDSLSTKPSCLIKKNRYALKFERKPNRNKPRDNSTKKNKRNETRSPCSSKEGRIQDLIKENLLYSEYAEQPKKYSPKISHDRRKLKKKDVNKKGDEDADEDEKIGFKVESSTNSRSKNRITVKCSRKSSRENARKARAASKINGNLKHRKESKYSIAQPEKSDNCQNTRNLTIDPTEDNEVSVFFENQKLSSLESSKVGKSFVSYSPESVYPSEQQSVIDTSYSNVNTVIDCQIVHSITTLDSKDTIKARESQEIIEHSIVDSGYMTKGAEINCSLTTLASSINDLKPCQNSFNESQFQQKSYTPRFNHTSTEWSNSRWNENDLIKLKNQLLFPDVYDDFELISAAKNTELIKYYVESVNYKLKEAIDSISNKKNITMHTKSRSVISLPSVKVIPEEIAESGINGDISSECSFRTNEGGFYNYQKFVAQNNERYSSAILSLVKKPEASGDRAEYLKNDEISDSDTASIRSSSSIKRKAQLGRRKSLVELFKGKTSSARKSNSSIVSVQDNIVEVKEVDTAHVKTKMSDDDFFNNFHHIMSIECQKYAKKVREECFDREDARANENFEEIPLNCLLNNRNSTIENSVDCLDYEFELASEEVDDNNNEKFPKLKGRNDEKSSESFKSLTCIDDCSEKLKTDFVAKRWQKMQRKQSSLGEDSKMYLDFYPEEKTSILDMIKTANISAESPDGSPRIRVVDMSKQSEKRFFDNLLSFYDKEAEFVKKLIRDDEFFASLIEAIRNDEDSTTLIYHKDIQKKCRKEKKKGLLSRLFRWKEKKSSEALGESSSIDKSLEFAKSLSGGAVSLAKDSSYSISRELEDLDKDISEKSSAKVPNCEYLQQLAHKAKIHLEPMVQATMSNRHISDKIKLAGFLKLLDMVEKGDFTFLTVEDDNKSLEEKLRENVAQMFEKVYRIANREIQQRNSILDNDKIQLLKILVTKYHMGVDTHVNILAIYIGRGLIQAKPQLEDGILYLMGQDTQEVNLEQFEQNCGIQSG